MSDPGPYINEQNGQVYFPIRDWSYNEARREAASHARMEMNSAGRSRYLGTREIACHDHDEPWDSSECQCKPEPAWVFETYEGTYR